MTIPILVGIIALAQLAVIIFVKGATCKGEEDFHKMRQKLEVVEGDARGNHKSIVNLYREVIPQITGGLVWHTQDGHTVTLRQMSDNHIENCLVGGFGSSEARQLLKIEQLRRTSDDMWSARNEQISPRVLLQLHTDVLKKLIQQ